ncbi:hypothetical protein [Pelomonas cellulosilytica]|uniref:DUF4019 domain-containing protein n=1 Tax=Pelomonas cellulosilytica TaxID=2906762 RepID=A0ABS8XUU2_9BURK|nr:hypothetical protein [Pelomonas sp. P8]MCE4554489.1 hypothetical protein [Pelomonas sp. P8]
MTLRQFGLSLLLSVTAALAFAQPAKSPEELLERSKQAFASKDARAYRSLVVLSRESDWPAAEAEFRRNAQQPLRSAKLLPLSAYQANYDRAVKRGMKTGMQDQGWVELEFEPVTQPGGLIEKSSMVLIFGRKDGGYFLGS